MNIIELTPDIAINLDEVSSITRHPDGNAQVVVGGKVLNVPMRYEDMKEFLKNASRIKTEMAY